MADPCIQEHNLGEMQATLRSLGETLLVHDRREEQRDIREERMMAALEKVASQGTSIDFLVGMAKDQKKDLGEAFNRLRDLEARPSTAPYNMPLQILNSSVGIYIFAFILATCLICLYANYPIFVAAYKFYK